MRSVVNGYNLFFLYFHINQFLPNDCSAQAAIRARGTF